MESRRKIKLRIYINRLFNKIKSIAMGTLLTGVLTGLIGVIAGVSQISKSVQDYNSTKK